MAQSTGGFEAMRKINLTRLVLGSLVLMWFTSVLSTALAADNQALDHGEHIFLSRAMADNASQMAMAKLALQKSKNPQIVALANMILTERAALDEKLATIAGKSVDRAALLQAATNCPRMAALQSLDGDTFDRTFAGQMIRDHYQIIPAYEAVKFSTANVAIKSFAHDAVPAMQGNLAVALSFLRDGGWRSASHQQVALNGAAADAHASKVPVYWESLSIVAAPW
jgi:putative membrane protein